MSPTETTIRCPLCGRDGIPHDARFSPFCEQVLPIPPTLDFSKYITKHTRDLTASLDRGAIELCSDRHFSASRQPLRHRRYLS
jgi:hypothetical protein